jgi:hypothetical protein
VLYYILEKNAPPDMSTAHCYANLTTGKCWELILQRNADAYGSGFQVYYQEEKHCYEPMNEHIKNNYHLIRTFDGDIYVYEKNVN